MRGSPRAEHEARRMQGKGCELAGSSLVLLPGHSRLECSFHSGFWESPPPLSSMQSPWFAQDSSDGFPFCISTLVAASTNRHQTSGLKQQKCILSQFWRTKSRSAGPAPFGGSREKSVPCLSHFWRPHLPNLCLLVTSPPPLPRVFVSCLPLPPS